MICALGGIPKVQAVVPELVHLHAGAVRRLELEVPDAKGDGPERAVERSHETDPAAVVAATRHALALVDRGDFIAAWGAVAHLAPPLPISAVFRWLYQWATSMPHEPDQAPPPDFPLPRSDQRALAAALRVELALRRGDTAHAIQKTFAFFEAAILDVLSRDHIREVTKATQKNGRTAFTLFPTPTESLMKDVKKTFPLASSDPLRHYLNNFGDGAFIICRQYIAKLQPCSATATAVLSFADAVANIKQLRDLVAHGEPNRDRLRHATGEMQDSGLWSSAPTSDDDAPSILAQPLFQDALRALGAPALADQMTTLRRATRAHALAAWSAA